MPETCVIFDLDGTLVDTETLCNQAFLDLLPDLDETLDQLVARYRGVQMDRIYRDLETRAGIRLPEDFETIYRRRVAELFEDHLKPMPGVFEMLDSLNLPICIASSGPLRKIRHSLGLSGLAPYFGDNVFSAYEVGSWKPDPGLFLHAARTMGFAPAACAVVEDSDVGVTAALSAGMRAFHYRPTGTPSPFSQATSLTHLTQLNSHLPRR